MTTRIEKSDLARDALYDKVNTMIDEVNTKIDNKDSLPSQTGNTGKFLTTDGTNASWGEVKQIEIKQDLTNPSADTVPSTKAVSDESSRLESIMDTKVSKTADEAISGIKTFQGDMLCKQSTRDFREIPSSPIYTEIRNLDVNGFEIGQFRVWKEINGANVIDLLGRYQDGTANIYGATLGIKTYADGTSFTYADANDFNNSIVTTISHGSNYVRFGNGLQICWGYYTGGNYNYPVPFKDTNYMLSVTYEINAEGQSYSYAAKIRNKQNTFFECWINAYSNYIAIGYWY